MPEVGSANQATPAVLDASIAGAAEAHLRQIALQLDVVMEVASRRTDDMPGLVEALQDDVVVTVGGTNRAALGWFAPRVWRHGGRAVHELFVNADRRMGHRDVSAAEDVMVTLLHEAAHLFASINDIDDTSRLGRYHNRKFGRIALTIGLHVVRHSSVGHTTPGLSAWGRHDYADLLDRLTEGQVLVREPAITVAPGGEDPSRAAGHPASHSAPRAATAAKYTFASCRCRASRGAVTIRVAKGSWRPGTILCAACGTSFDETPSTRPEPDHRTAEVPPSDRDASAFLMCPSGKREYPDEASAVAELRSIRRRSRPDRNKATTECAAYPCGTCGKWHLTAAPQNKRRTGAPRSRSRR